MADADQYCGDHARWATLSDDDRVSRFRQRVAHQGSFATVIFAELVYEHR
ncbi:hypothetical protein ACFQVB_02340 [Paraburkholderia humisilvae]